MSLHSHFRDLRRFGALTWLTCVLAAGLLAPETLAPPDLLHTSQPPFQQPYWFGTDPQGIDVGAALVHGARTVLLISLPATILTMALGTMLGSAAGFWGNTRYQVSRGWGLAWGAFVCGGVVLAPQLLRHPVATSIVLILGFGLLAWGLTRFRWSSKPYPIPLDAAVLGLIALLDSIPLLILILVVAAVQRPSVGGLALLMTLACWTTPARLMRAATLQVRGQVYLEAARSVGLSDGQLLLRYVWPNTWRVLLVRFPLTMALLVSLEATLSFLGVGLPPETPSWGRLLASVRQDPTAWWLLAWPGLALALTLLSLQSLGNRK